VSLTDEIKSVACSCGADLVGVASSEVYSDYLKTARARLAETGAALSDFMIRPDDVSFFECLANPRITLAQAKAILVLGVGAYDKAAVYANAAKQLRGKTARTYSYYPVIRQIAEKVAAVITERGYSATQGQDIPLKYVADRIGLGAYGRNGLLLTDKYGSYVALRAILTDAPLEPDRFEKTIPCNDCGACIKACPTGALYEPYKVNPKLCINPITRKDEYIHPDVRPKMSNWIHGCDICQEVCPVNKSLVARDIDPRCCFDPIHHASHKYLHGLDRTPKLCDIVSGKYPDVIQRNAAIALANVGKASIEAPDALKQGLAKTDGELAEYYQWAIGKLENS
jgi:epoxyqueuosine reductase